MTYILAADPGVSGGLVALYDGAVEEVITMPATERDLLDWFRTFHESSVAWIEWIHPAIQGIGKSPMSKLYGNYMQLRMCCHACQIRFETVQARKWQQALGIPPRGKTETQSQWKNRLKAKAQELYPDLAITLAVSDALLIAEYGRRQAQ